MNRQQNWAPKGSATSGDLLLVGRLKLLPLINATLDEMCQDKQGQQLAYFKVPRTENKATSTHNLLEVIHS